MKHAEFAIPRRPLGRTGFEASVLGIGDLADRNLPLATCVATLRRAIEAGLNLLDTAPGYEDGYSEEIVAAALQEVLGPGEAGRTVGAGGVGTAGVGAAGVGTAGSGVAGSGAAGGMRRDELFVIDKIDDLEGPVEPQIDASLARLGLAYTDAFVFHGLSSMAVFERLAAPGGGFDQLAACIGAGKTRFGGISSHDPDVLRAAIEAGLCDIVMFPVGPFVDERYIAETLPLAKARGVGTVCFKTFGAGKLLGDTQGYNQPLQLRPRGKLSSGGVSEAVAVLPRLSVAECLHYTLTLEPDVALLGMSFPNEQDAALEAARSFTPLSRAQMAEIKARAVEARREKGPCWWNPDPEA
jgi:aryl-alcohol dehydrogenase-like predicted oxidoreductase